MVSTEPRTLTPARIAIRLIQLAVIVVIGWGIYHVLEGELRQLTWSDIVRWRPALWPLVASFALLVSTYFVHALLWRRIMSDLQIGRLTVPDTIRVYFTASLGRYLPGKVWSLAGMAVLAGRAGLPPLFATAAAILGQIAFLATGMLFLALALPQWLLVSGGSGTVITILIALLILGGTTVWLLAETPFGHGVREWLVARAGRFGPGVAAKLRSAFTLADRITLKSAAIWAVAYFLTWVAIGAAFAVFVSAFVPGTENYTRYLAGTIAASYLLGYVMPLPAGIGAREAVMLVLLQPVVPDAGAAVVISVLSRVWFTAAELVPVAAIPILRPGTLKETPD